MLLAFDGGKREVRVAPSEIQRVHDPLVQRMARAAEHRRRCIVVLAGPPGAGKSTIASIWVARAVALDLPPPFQSLSMDGFHLPNRVLDARTATAPDGTLVPLRRLKGVPESYDLEALSQAFQRLRDATPFRWPVYDRTIHDPVAGALAVMPQGVVIVEGNFLLLDEPGFRELRPLADLAVFVACGEEVTRSRVRARFREGGREAADARRHLEEVDVPNWRRVMGCRAAADVVLEVGLRRPIRLLGEPGPGPAGPRRVTRRRDG